MNDQSQLSPTRTSATPTEGEDLATLSNRQLFTMGTESCARIRALREAERRGAHPRRIRKWQDLSPQTREAIEGLENRIEFYNEELARRGPDCSQVTAQELWDVYSAISIRMAKLADPLYPLPVYERTKEQKKPVQVSAQVRNEIDFLFQLRRRADNERCGRHETHERYEMRSIGPDEQTRLVEKWTAHLKEQSCLSRLADK